MPKDPWPLESSHSVRLSASSTVSRAVDSFDGGYPEDTPGGINNDMDNAASNVEAALCIKQLPYTKLSAQPQGPSGLDILSSQTQVLFFTTTPNSTPLTPQKMHTKMLQAFILLHRFFLFRHGAIHI